MKEDFTGFKSGSGNKLQIHNVVNVETQIHAVNQYTYVLNLYIHTKGQDDFINLELFLDKNEPLRVQSLTDWISKEVQEAIHANQG